MDAGACFELELATCVRLPYGAGDTRPSSQQRTYSAD